MGKIRTTYNIKDEVWFYDKGVLDTAKIVFIETQLSINGLRTKYTLERIDQTYKDYKEHGYMFLNRDENIPYTEFAENELASTKEELIKKLVKQENFRHQAEVERIKNL